MRKGKIIQIDYYRDNLAMEIENKTPAPCKEDLESAIQHLIYQLRELGPLPSMKKNVR